MNKNRKKILIASPFFYPEPISTGKYNTFLAKTLLEKGHRVTVICSYPFYPDWYPKFTSENILGALTFRGGLENLYPKNTVTRRIILEIWFCWHFFKNRNKLAEIIVAILPPVFFTIFLKVFFKASKKVAIVHDFAGVMATSYKSCFRKFIAVIMKKSESILLRNFDKVICLSESMKEMAIHDYGLKKSRCDVQYPFVTIETGEDGPCTCEEIFLPDRVHVVYSGALGEKQQPKVIYQIFLDICERNENVLCHFFSRGQIFNKLKSDNKNSKICFHDLVPENLLSKLYACSDVQVVPQAPGISTGSFPSKVSNLIASGVPILAICEEDSELAKVITQNGAGRAVSCSDNKKIIDSLKALLKETRNESRPKRKMIAEKFVSENFNINKLVDSIINT